MKKLLLLFCFIAAILATSCSKEYGSGYDETTWNGENGELLCTVEFSGSGSTCTITFGSANAWGIGRATYDVQWSSRRQFMLYKNDPPQLIYSGSISGDRMTLESVDGTFACELTRKKK